MKAMSFNTVYLKNDTLQPETPVNIIKLPFYSFVFINDFYCGPLRTSAIKDHFIKER